ncbi:hypothetical protein GF373_17315 [bacterium]|nr:hypothetical protein [bacterium]
MKPYYQKHDITIYHGNCLDIMPYLPKESFQLVFTDPPYPKEYSYLWDYLGQIAFHAMKKDAVLLSYCGHYQLPTVTEALGRYLKYWWLFIARNNSSPIVWGYKIKACFKPIVAYIKDTQPVHRLPGMFPDDLHVAGAVRTAKSLHHWGQSPIPEPILRFTDEKTGLVLDPFMGSGTTLFEAKKWGRQAVGIETEEKYCEIAASRMDSWESGVPPLEAKAGQKGLWD